MVIESHIQELFFKRIKDDEFKQTLGSSSLSNKKLLADSGSIVDQVCSLRKKKFLAGGHNSRKDFFLQRSLHSLCKLIFKFVIHQLIK